MPDRRIANLAGPDEAAGPAGAGEREAGGRGCPDIDPAFDRGAALTAPRRSGAITTKSVTSVSPETMREHRATWWVYTGAMVNGRRERIRRQARMRGVWPGYDVTCSCGYETRLGATRGAVTRDLLAHRLLAQYEKDYG